MGFKSGTNSTPVSASLPSATLLLTGDYTDSADRPYFERITSNSEVVPDLFAFADKLAPVLYRDDSAVNQELAAREFRWRQCCEIIFR